MTRGMDVEVVFIFRRTNLPHSRYDPNTLSCHVIPMIGLLIEQKHAIHNIWKHMETRVFDLLST